MQAIAVERGTHEPVIIERPRPDPAPGEALVRTLRVGVDGTDHEVIAGGHGGYPAGDDYLILGHEAVGVVEDPGETRFSPGEVVVPTVRRPPGETNAYFERGEPDFAPAGEYYERGIEGAHGFMAEYFTSHEEFLVSVPPEVAKVGFLVEPLSVAEKALELAAAARSSFTWEPAAALVLGNGSLGLLALAMLSAADDYDRLYCLGRRDRPDPTIDVIERLGATYIDSRQTPVATIPDEHEPMDLIFEATGYAKHAFASIDALAPNGVGTLLGVPGSWEFEIDGGRLQRELVLGNKALLGSVNSNVRHFVAAATALAELPGWFREAMVTGVYGLEEFPTAFVDDDTTIKTAVQFSAYEECG